MIPDARVKAIARAQNVDPMVIDLDHALGVVLWSLSATSDDAVQWVFKGGTCLRKAYYEDYRFSEDLDFTVLGRLGVETVRARIDRAARLSAGQGVELLLEETRVSLVNDDYGRESIEVLAPYRGALVRRGTPRNVQLHLSADERVLLDIGIRRLLHPYEDAAELVCTLECYSPEEMLAEKLRAAGGQRQYAISRDVYDISHLVARGADEALALRILPEKAQLKSVDLSVAASRFSGRRDEYRADWRRALAHLVNDDTDFDSAFDATEGLLRKAQKAVLDRRSVGT